MKNTPSTLQGTTAEVFRCTYKETKVAVKLFYKLQAPEARKEIELVFELRHPNVVGILGFFQIENSGKVGIIFELCAHGDLTSAYKKDWFTDSVRLKILWGCARALFYMHSFPAPIVHRDLKCGNILVTDDWVGKVGDCGASRRIDLNSTMTQVGTPVYAAPEILKGRRYDE